MCLLFGCTFQKKKKVYWESFQKFCKFFGFNKSVWKCAKGDKGLKFSYFFFSLLQIWFNFHKVECAKCAFVTFPFEIIFLTTISQRPDCCSNKHLLSICLHDFRYGRVEKHLSARFLLENVIIVLMYECECINVFILFNKFTIFTSFAREKCLLKNKRKSSTSERLKKCRLKLVFIVGAFVSMFTILQLHTVGKEL